jgi:nicotinamidase-related amidase
MFERRPADTAPIIVIDLQTGMFDGAVEPPIHDSAGLVARVRAVMEWARRVRRKIAFVRHADRRLIVVEQRVAARK